MRTFILLLLFPTCDTVLFGIGRKQSVGVLGVLTCNGKPAQEIKVKLYEKELLVDRKLDQGKTDASGWFKLSGSAREISPIDPELNIYHKCNYKGPCHKKFSIVIPSKYISGGDIVEEYFDIGIVELAAKPKSQTTDCMN